MSGIRALLAGIVDYAGLFPPAKLDMATTVRNYAKYVAGDHAWMLGRLVVPVSRLDEFEREAGEWLPREEDAEPWRISALVGEDLDADIDRIFAFNRAHAEDTDAGLGVIDTIEAKAATPEAIDEAMRIVPEQIQPFFEVPWKDDPRAFITAIAGTGAMAKIRTGGVTPDLIPPVEALVRFILACHAAGVGFKATAGLHHPVRAEHPLTYEPDAPRATMHGYLNVFIGAGLVRFQRADEHALMSVLSDEEPDAFQADHAGVAWRATRVDNEQLEKLRSETAISFGSCSFDEPVEDLAAMGLLPTPVTGKE